MTSIQFHFNVPDRLAYACRLLRKATRKVSGITVLGEEAELERLNRQLWMFEPTEFLPHLLLKAHQAVAAPLASTPVWLVTRVEQSPPRHTTLVNLGAEPVAGFERYERLVEIVSTDAQDRDAARARWRHYAAMGCPIEKFEVGSA
jgi:DNA polymerase-3 subunit chi